MTLGPVMVDLEGLELTSEERTFLRQPAVGGVILFSRNYESPEQVRELIDQVHGLRNPSLLVAVDQEGGRVQRFRDGFTRLPAVRHLGDVYDADRQRALALADTSGWLMAAELRAVGVDLSFAPVLDLDRGVSTVIGDRAFHSRPEACAEIAHAYQRGMQRAGMMATGKHFPGHGAVAADSHLALPVDERGYEDLLMEDLVPFERMSHFGVAALMVAHVIYARADQHPAGFSSFWLKEVLRRRIGFQGAVFSDDLTMAAAEYAGDHVARARAALEAGCDMVLVCNAQEDARRVVRDRERYHDPAAMMRLVRLHGQGEWNRTALQATAEWQESVAAVQGYDPEPLLDMDL